MYKFVVVVVVVKNKPFEKKTHCFCYVILVCTGYITGNTPTTFFGYGSHVNKTPPTFLWSHDFLVAVT